MTGLRISSTLSLPIDFVTKTCAILAQRRVGKTYTASVLAEEFVGAGIPFVALDPTGAWWGLRAAADGVDKGLPVVILGGPHGDVPLERTAGAFVAELVVDYPGHYVIDFTGFDSGAAERQFAVDFAERIYRRKGRPGSDFALHLFVDEADRFIPQRVNRQDQSERLLGAFETIVRRGGLRGLGTTLISQRAAVVNKNVLEQLDLLVILRTVGPNDRKAIESYVKANGTDEDRALLMSSLASLALGEAWLWEPGAEPPLFERVQIRKRRTFNSSATPKAGEVRVEPRQLAAVDIEAITAQMADAIERAKADDPKELHRQITELKRQLKVAEAATPEAIERIVEVEKIVVPAAFFRAADDVVAATTEVVNAVRRLTNVRDNLGATIIDLPAPGDTHRREAQPVPSPRGPSPRAAGSTSGRGAQPPAPAGDSTITGLGRQMLTVLAMHGPLTRQQLALHVGKAMKGGYFRNTLSSLRTAGHVGGDVGKAIEITPEGKAALGAYDPLPTGPALVSFWCSEVGGLGAEIIRAALVAWPRVLSKDELAEATGKEAAGGYFRNTLSRLRTLGLLEGCAPSPTLVEAEAS